MKNKKATFLAYLFRFLVSLIDCSKDKSIFYVCVKWEKATKLALMAPQKLSWNALTEHRPRQKNSGFEHHQEQADSIYMSTCLPTPHTEKRLSLQFCLSRHQVLQGSSLCPSDFHDIIWEILGNKYPKEHRQKERGYEALNL